MEWWCGLSGENGDAREASSRLTPARTGAIGHEGLAQLLEEPDQLNHLQVREALLFLDALAVELLGAQVLKVPQDLVSCKAGRRRDHLSGVCAEFAWG